MESSIPPDIPEQFEVHVLKGKIETIVPATGRFDFVGVQESFIVLEE